MHSVKRICSFIVLLVLLSCARPVSVTRPEDALKQVSWKAVSAEDDRFFIDAAAAVRRSLEYYRKMPADTLFTFGPEQVTALDMVVTLRNFLLVVENDSLSYEEKVRRIKMDFALYQSAGSDGKGKILFTGYYEPVLSCRQVRNDVYQYPLYKRPDDIIEVDLTLFGNGFPQSRLLGRLEGKKVVPYFSREEIDHKNALADRALEILWCSDPVDIYFLQVQGSGKVDLGDGNIMSVLYDGVNGRVYKGIGGYLIQAGIIPKEEMCMQKIRQYLRENPQQAPGILNRNPSYVFFRLDTTPSVGNIGVPLTPGRSIATDSRLFPKGALAFIAAEKPVIENNMIREWIPFTRFVMNQDTGGAIRGAGRVDLFWGQGEDAELGAGYMQQEGRLYFLLRKK